MPAGVGASHGDHVDTMKLQSPDTEKSLQPCLNMVSWSLLSVTAPIMCSFCEKWSTVTSVQVVMYWCLATVPTQDDLTLRCLSLFLNADDLLSLLCIITVNCIYVALLSSTIALDL